jgi:hypothetical protein
MALLALTPGQKISLAIAIISGFAALMAALAVYLSIIHERRRTQPITIANEARSRYSLQVAGKRVWAVDGFVSNEGGGPAFNVRFGVEFRGYRFPYKLSTEDPDSGNVQRVVPAGKRIPKDGVWSILINSERSGV